LNDKEGIVFILDGAGGSGWTPTVLRHILSELPYEIHHFRWGHGYMRIIKDLTNRDNTRRRSEELAGLIRDYKSKFPERRIYVIAKSAGTAPAVMALSQLEDDTVERAFLLSPAISPGFDLSRALASTKLDLYSFWSPHDHFWLGFGTTLFGTADGVPGRAAGLTGFKRPDDPQRILHYAKLREIAWTPSMLWQGHLGGHPGNSMPPFIRKYILPLLT
jgi:hypothetical protein